MGLFSDHRISLWDLNQTLCKDLVGSNSAPSPSPPDQGAKDMELVFVVVLMALMGSTLYGTAFLQLFIGRNSLYLPLIRGRYNLYTIIRILLHFTMVLFVPLLSSMLSNKENGDEVEILLVILWMLLIELIRKKVQTMVLPTDGSSFSRGTGRFTLMDNSDEAARLVWIGYLIYSNMKVLEESSTTEGKFVVAMFVVLWSLSLVKLVQRVVATWLASRSWITAKNPLLIAGYMQHVLDEEEKKNVNHVDNMMSSCRYAVMGEDTLVVGEKERLNKGEDSEEPLKLAILEFGYGVGRRLDPHQDEHKDPHLPRYDQSEQKQVHLLINHPPEPHKKPDSALVTVGDIWDYIETSDIFQGRKSKNLAQNLCLSFSLFKMLRRRFEHYPMVEVGSVVARKLMLEGLLGLVLWDNPNDIARPFQILQLELEFLENYYQAAVAPVVMSQPILFFSNILLSVIFVVIYLAAVLAILIRQKGATYLVCISLGWPSDLQSFPTLYLSITMLLVVTLIAIEATEFWASYALSNWNTVRLLCSYTLRPKGVIKQIFRLFICLRLWVHSLLKQAYDDIRMDQVSIVNACWPLDEFSFSESASYVTLTNDCKKHIVVSLKKIDPNIGTIRMPSLSGLDTRGRTCTEVILACHLATQLLKVDLDVNKGRRRKKTRDEQEANALSRYCMYLVARKPELLPDDEEWLRDRYEDMMSCLKQVSGKPCGVKCTPSFCCRKKLLGMLALAEDKDLKDRATRDGFKIFRQRKGEAEHVWEDLAEFWVNLLIYLAPSNDVQGHAKALASSGGDLINCLWAFCTHAGITREPLDQHNVADQNA